MQKQALFEAKDCLLICIDIQEKLLPVMYNKEIILKNANILLEAARLFKLKALVSEQYPKGLGNTHSSIEFKTISKFEDFDEQDTHLQCLCLEKISFSIFNDEKIVKVIKESGCKKLIVFGIESHVCVLQSLIHALERGYELCAIEDAMGSRSKENHDNALSFLRQKGVNIINTESFLFGLMIDAKEANFKSISALIK